MTRLEGLINSLHTVPRSCRERARERLATTRARAAPFAKKRASLFQRKTHKTCQRRRGKNRRAAGGRAEEEEREEGKASKEWAPSPGDPREEEHAAAEGEGMVPVPGKMDATSLLRPPEILPKNPHEAKVVEPVVGADVEREDAAEEEEEEEEAGVMSFRRIQRRHRHRHCLRRGELSYEPRAHPLCPDRFRPRPALQLPRLLLQQAPATASGKLPHRTFHHPRRRRRHRRHSLRFRNRN